LSNCTFISLSPVSLSLNAPCFVEKAKLSAAGSTSAGRQGEWLPAGFLEHNLSAAFDEGLLGDAEQQLEGRMLMLRMLI